MLNKTQIIVLGIFAGLFCLLYFGMDTKSQKHKAVEKSRALNVESTNISNLLMEAKDVISDGEHDIIHAYELQLNVAGSDEDKVIILEQLSSKWYELGHEEISGFFASEIAEIRNTDTAWSIAGTTYILCLQNSKSLKIKQYCSKNGIRAIENAISINPDEINHQVNMAVCLAEFPPEDNPMEGIMKLLSLSREHPDHIGVLYQLARLGLKTGQFEKAIGRCERILEIDPQNRRANCLLARIYEELNNPALASQYGALCINQN